MKVYINGEERSFKHALPTLADLLDEISVPAERTAVELNGSVVERHQFASTALKDDDRMEIVSFVGGG